MTAKEKAVDLFEQFYDTTPNESWMNEPLCLAKNYSAKEQAKQCALIAVEELIIEEGRWNNGSFYPSYYWKEVKEEIEKFNFSDKL